MKNNIGNITNYGFLSKHFIETRLKGWREFSEISQKANEVFQEIRLQYQKYSSTFQKANESQLEADWIRFILEKLGYFYIPQPSDYKNKFPDHALYPSEKEKIEAKNYRQNSSIKMAKKDATL